MQSHGTWRHHVLGKCVWFEESKRKEVPRVFYVKDCTSNGWDEMMSRRGLTADVQRTPYKDVGFVSLGSINPRFTKTAQRADVAENSSDF